MKMIKYMLISLALSACAATTGKVASGDKYLPVPNGSLIGDLNLVVSSSEVTPAGELVIPKTTDLSSVVLLKPVLVLSSRALDGESCEEK